MADDGDEVKFTGTLTGVPSVFISYASPDIAIAQAACEALERSGVSCWIAPRNVRTGTFYADEIVHALDDAKAIVLILSQESAKSPHVLREVERAASKRRPLISLRIDQALIPPGLEYFVNTSQWLDASTGNVASALPELVAAVRLVTAKPTTAAALTPGSAVTTPTLPTPAPVRPTRPRRWAAPLTGAVVVAIIAALFVYKPWQSSHRSAAPAPSVADPATQATERAEAPIPEKSIAVLPFVDMSEKKDQEYFADGMAEEIINLLARVSDLRVPARTSSFYFKGKPTKIPDIARELGVANVLEGSIRRSGNRLRVTAQLVRADNGYHLWSQTYDRDLKDVFVTQDDIANAVVQALQITLMGGGPLTRQTGGTQNLEAYQWFLRALSAVNQPTTASLEAADGYVDQAIKLDPDFGGAWSLKASVAMIQAAIGARTPNDGFERARQLAQHALKLSPNLPEAHFMLAFIHRTYDWDWTATQAELRLGQSIDPTNEVGLMYAAFLSKTLGHWEDAERQVHAALDRDPLSTLAHAILGDTFYLSGRFAEAETEFRKLEQMAPDYLSTRVLLAQTLLAEGRPDAGLAMAQQVTGEGTRLCSLPIFLQAVGRKTEADEMLKQDSLKFADSHAFDIALVYAFRNERDSAFEWLDRAYKQRDPELIAILGEPLLKNLVNDPRYQAFLQKMNLTG